MLLSFHFSLPAKRLRQRYPISHSTSFDRQLLRDKLFHAWTQNPHANFFTAQDLKEFIIIIISINCYYYYFVVLEFSLSRATQRIRPSAFSRTNFGGILDFFGIEPESSL